MTRIIVLLHLFATLTAAVLMAVSLGFGVLALRKQLQLKRKDLRVLEGGLPPVATMESDHFRWLKIGFLGLTVGLGTGFFLLSKVSGATLWTGHTLLAAACWVLYAIVLNHRWFDRWYTGRLIGLSLLGFLMLVIVFLQVPHGQ